MRLKKYSRFLVTGLVACLMAGQTVCAADATTNLDKKSSYEEQGQTEIGGTETGATVIEDESENGNDIMTDECDDRESQETGSNQRNEETDNPAGSEDIGKVDIQMNADTENMIATQELASSYKIRYRVHVQTYGWMDWTDGDTIAGTVGKSKRLEAIQIQIVDKNGNTADNLHVEYRVHAQSYGWMDWVSDGKTAGTEGKAKRLEAIQIRLRSDDGKQYNVSYKTHVQSYGWMDTVKNANIAGTTGKAKRMEAVIISLADSIQNPVDAGTTPIQNTKASIIYSGHVQTYGNVGAVKNGEVLGTVGQSKRIEGIKIDLIQPEQKISGNIVYSAHIQTYGWSQDTTDGNYCGTTGQSKRLEAIKISLTGELAEKYDVYYRTHIQTYGWLGWTKNGEAAGSEGCAKRMEAVQIKLVAKGEDAPDTTQKAFVKKITDSSNSDTSNGVVVIPTNDIVKKIKSYATVPYFYGGNNLTGWDCSGCVQWICKNVFNVSVSRTSYTQVKDGVTVNISDPSQWKIGDILCFGGTEGVTHTAVYIGDGQMFHAVNEKYGTMVQNIKAYEAWETGLKLVAVRRVL